MWRRESRNTMVQDGLSKGIHVSVAMPFWNLRNIVVSLSCVPSFWITGKNQACPVSPAFKCHALYRGLAIECCLFVLLQIPPCDASFARCLGHRRSESGFKLCMLPILLFCPPCFTLSVGSLCRILDCKFLGRKVPATPVALPKSEIKSQGNSKVGLPMSK